jgi:carbohydrate-selective porin OprB
MAKTIFYGNLAGSTDAVRMPQKAYQNGLLKAHPANTGNVYIGSSSDVVLGGTTDTAGGFPLDAGDVYVLGAPGDLNELWYITDGATDYLAYIIEVF